MSRIKNFLNNANLEAAGAQEERVELNKREPDEGDLFGVRAIQSGFFGGVAQSRPSSLAGSISPEGSSSNTLRGSHASSKLAPQSPMSSTTTLPLDARRSSPLAHKAMSSEDLNTPSTPKRRMPTPLRSTLAPSDAELSGRLTHDPAVNMFLEIPPSPVVNSRPPTVYSDTHDRTPSGYFPSPHNGGQYAPLGAPQVPEQVRRSSARPVSTAETHQPQQGHHSQSASIASGTSDPYIQDGPRSSTAGDKSFVAIPGKAVHDERGGSHSSEERPRSRGREDLPRPGRSHPPRSSSRYNNFPQMPTIHSQEDEALPKLAIELLAGKYQFIREPNPGSPWVPKSSSIQVTEPLVGKAGEQAMRAYRRLVPVSKAPWKPSEYQGIRGFLRFVLKAESSGARE
ncbi:MAG: hypothetical protein Q9184_002791 [Pyrenodesmia sp. 2 TL-2023]